MKKKIEKNIKAWFWFLLCPLHFVVAYEHEWIRYLYPNKEFEKLKAIQKS